MAEKLEMKEGSGGTLLYGARSMCGPIPNHAVHVEAIGKILDEDDAHPAWCVQIDWLFRGRLGDASSEWGSHADCWKWSGQRQQGFRPSKILDVTRWNEIIICTIRAKSAKATFEITRSLLACGRVCSHKGQDPHQNVPIPQEKLGRRGEPAFTTILL